MKNAEKFLNEFGIYATELWASPEKAFLEWLNADVPDTNVGDMIYRQAAIDAIRASTSKYTGFMEMEMYTDDDAVEAINGVPSAQPETAKRIVGKSRDGMTLWYQCDMCNEPVDAQDNFCRGCGRRLTDG